MSVEEYIKRKCIIRRRINTHNAAFGRVGSFTNHELSMAHGHFLQVGKETKKIRTTSYKRMTKINYSNRELSYKTSLPNQNKDTH